MKPVEHGVMDQDVYEDENNPSGAMKSGYQTIESSRHEGASAIRRRNSSATTKQAQNAMHEAGHVVAGYAFRIPIMQVSIVPDSSMGSIGQTLFSPDYDPPDLFGRLDLLVKDFCGYATEEIAGYRDLGDWMQSDRMNLESSLPGLIRLEIVQKGEEQAFEKQLLQYARALIDKNWTAVQKFAKVLGEKRRMSGQAAEQLCSQLGVQRRQPGSEPKHWTLP